MQGFEVDQKVSLDELQAALHNDRFLFGPCGFIARRSEIGYLLLKKQAEAIRELRLARSMPCGSGYTQVHQNDNITLDIIKNIAYISYRWAQSNKTLGSETSLDDSHGLLASQSWGVHPCKVFDLFQALIGTRLYNDYIAVLPDGYRLDKILFGSVSNVPGHGSTQWHRDSVGNRIKIFLVLEASNMSPTTAIVPNSQFELAYAMNIDLIRTLQASDGSGNIGLATSIQYNIAELLARRFKSSIAVIKQDVGSIFVFDTNSWHMAWKPCMHGSDQSPHSRLALELEFMDKQRSDFAADFLGPCAPGQNLLYWYIQDQIHELMDSFKIDPTCLHDFISMDGKAVKCYSTQKRFNRWHDIIGRSSLDDDFVTL